VDLQKATLSQIGWQGSRSVSVAQFIVTRLQNQSHQADKNIVFLAGGQPCKGGLGTRPYIWMAWIVGIPAIWIPAIPAGMTGFFAQTKQFRNQQVTIHGLDFGIHAEKTVLYRPLFPHLKFYTGFYPVLNFKRH